MTSSQQDFAGRRVVVTGAGRGIGRGIAEAFARPGAKVMIGARTISYAEQARDAIRAAGGETEIHQLDVKTRAACEGLVAAAVAAFGGVDVIVHCAADIPHGGLGQVSDTDLEAGFASTAKAAWWLLEAARPHLAQATGGGRFIAIGSVNGTATVVPNLTAYGMAKAALDAFVRGAAIDVVDDRITVNAVNPGLVASDRARAVLGEDGLEAYGATVPVGRAGTPADIARACLFLAGAEADYITGASLRIDGGATLAPGRDARGAILQNRLTAQIKKDTPT